MKYVTALSSLIIVLFLTITASAFTPVCELARQPINTKLNLSAETVLSYEKKIKQECELSKKWQTLKKKAENFSLSLEQITLYQALRYVDRFNYEQAAKNNIPVELIYQIKKEDYNKPLSQRSPLVWKNWATGIQQITDTREKIKNGLPVDLDLFKKIHTGFFAVGDESGEYGDVTQPGLFKPLNEGLVSWKLDNQEKADHAAKLTEIINRKYIEMDLQPTTEMTGHDDSINKLLNVLDLRFYSAHPKANHAHVQNLLKFLNEMLNQARSNQPMIWKQKLITPAELAYFIQQYIVQIHPFFDGNGRTSRFWQDTILSLFSLPSGASGDLMNNDMLSTHTDNYNLALTKSFEQLTEVEKCLDEVYPPLAVNFFWAKQTIYFEKINPNSIPYNCRFLK